MLASSRLTKHRHIYIYPWGDRPRQRRRKPPFAPFGLGHNAAFELGRCELHRIIRVGKPRRFRTSQRSRNRKKRQASPETSPFVTRLVFEPTDWEGRRTKLKGDQPAVDYSSFLDQFYFMIVHRDTCMPGPFYSFLFFLSYEPYAIRMMAPISMGLSDASSPSPFIGSQG